MAAILATVRTRAVRRLLLVFGAFRAAEFGVWIATTAVAFERGGVRQATAVVIAQLAPATLVATFVGAWADRYTPRRVLVAGLTVQACGMLGAGIALASGAPIILVYAAAVLASAAVSTTRPTIATLMPAAVRDPAELAAANVAIGWLDGAATLGGPAITAITIATIGNAAPFVLFGTVIAANALAARGAPDARVSRRRGDAPIETELEPPAVRVAIGEVARAPGPRSVLLVLASRAYVDGALDLLYVVVAVQVLGGGGADAGWMNTAYGGGAVLGAAASTMLIGRRALWPGIALGTILAAVALFGLGVAHETAAAAALFVAIGTGTALLLVASRTLLQRVTDLELLCHAFALAEAGDDTMLMLGSLTVPVIVAVLAPQWAGAGVALVLVVAVASQLTTVARADRRAQAPIERIELLRRVELFTLLSAPALETLAREAQPRRVARDTVLIQQGDAGDVFYVVVAGSFAITRAGTMLRTSTRGDGFGELALLFDTRRTATVTALEDSEVLAIGREAFLVAVTGEQATVHGVAAYVQMLDHSLGIWPGIAPEGGVDGGTG